PGRGPRGPPRRARRRLPGGRRARRGGTAAGGCRPGARPASRARSGAPAPRTRAWPGRRGPTRSGGGRRGRGPAAPGAADRWSRRRRRWTRRRSPGTPTGARRGGWPTGRGRRRWRRPWSPVDVPVDDGGVEALRSEDLGHLLGDGDRAVAPAGAPKGDGEVRLALRHVRGEERSEELPQVADEILSLVLVEHVPADGLVEAGVGAQLVHPVRVGQEPAVEHDVDVERQAVLVPEGHDPGLHAAGGVVVA